MRKSREAFVAPRDHAEWVMLSREEKTASTIFLTLEESRMIATMLIVVVFFGAMGRLYEPLATKKRIERVWHCDTYALCFEQMTDKRLLESLTTQQYMLDHKLEGRMVEADVLWNAGKEIVRQLDEVLLDYKRVEEYAIFEEKYSK